MSARERARSSEKETLIKNDDNEERRPARMGPAEPIKLSWKWSVVVLLFFFATFAWFIHILYSSVSASRTSHQTTRTERIHNRQSLSRAHQLLKENPLIDGHNDLAARIRTGYKNNLYTSNFTKLWEKGGLPGEVDLPRIAKGHYGGAFWSAFWICPANVTDYSDKAYDHSKLAEASFFVSNDADAPPQPCEPPFRN
jgi:hypothetical protein